MLIRNCKSKPDIHNVEVRGRESTPRGKVLKKYSYLKMQQLTKIRLFDQLQVLLKFVYKHQPLNFVFVSLLIQN
jgi:hypothetical protein